MAELSPPPVPLLDGAALFLDFDGTLVELADSPDSIRVSPALRSLLDRLHRKLGGRLAIVSGRSLADLDRHLPSSGIAFSGSHGLELKLADGAVLPLSVPIGLDDVHERVRRFAATAPGLIAEEKPAGIALHYRRAPAAADRAVHFIEALARERGFSVQHGNMVSELRPVGATKGDALEAFMSEPEFAGARPVFVGDDLTDEHAFAAAAALGGAGVLVGPARQTAARYRLPSVAAVAAWLGAAAEAGGVSNLDLWPIGNCQVSALIDNRAGFAWACQPRVDGDPLFCALLEPREPRGEWRMALEGQVSAVQRYLKNTPILVTRLTDAAGGIADVYDFCPRFERRGRMYRPVAFIRIVRPIAGAPRLKVMLTPAAGWGARDAARTSGTNHIRFLTKPQPLRLTTDAPIIHLLDSRAFRLEHSLHFFLGPDEPFVGDVGHTLATMLHRTADHWRDWVRGLAIPLEWQQVVIRAAITLKLCQHEETGAIVAALTTSIPEAANSGRDWDYRYCWIRDAYYTVQALNRLGALDVLESYLSYLRNIVDEAQGGHIQPLYAVSGEPKLEERVAEALAGYRFMGPVRVGNAAFTQVQHDAYGQIILSNAQAFFDERLLRPATREDFASLERVGELAWKRYDKPDAGLWEFRTRASVHTYSAVMSWAACDRLGNIALALGLAGRAGIWRRRAGKIRAAIEEKAWHPGEKRFAATFGGDELDASLLQLLDMRFLEPGDPRFIATFEAVEKGLRRGEHMLRYAAEDDFGRPETAFNFCTFWLIEALHLVGRTGEARALYQKMLARLTPAGLLSEDTDFETGELWGNYPQTYSLVGLINCAGLLSRPWSSVR